jgi:spore coat protein CotH
MGIDFQEGKGALEFDGKEWGSVSIRFKGNSSFNVARNSLKRSLKLDFNDVEKGRSFFGMTKLNLNNGAMDPSVMREALAYEVFRRGHGRPLPRSLSPCRVSTSANTPGSTPWWSRWMGNS